MPFSRAIMPDERRLKRSVKTDRLMKQNESRPHVLSVEWLQKSSFPEDWARSLGYVRNRRIDGLTIDTAQPGKVEINATLRAADQYRISLTWSVKTDAQGHCSADTPPASSETSCPETPLTLEARCGCPHQGPMLCRHAIAAGLQYLLQIGNLEAVEILVGSGEPWLTGGLDHSGKQVQILLQYNRLNDQIRVIPRLTHEDQIVLEIRQFFAEWPEWRPDDAGGLAMSGTSGLFRLFREILPRMPLEWVVHYDEELEKIRPRRRQVSIELNTPEIQEPGLLSFNVAFHCDRLSITLDQLRQYFHDQQQWLVENGRYIEIENRQQIESLLHLMDFGCESASFPSIAAFRAADLKNWADAALADEKTVHGDEKPQKASFGLVTFDESFKQFLKGLTLTSPTDSRLEPYESEGALPTLPGRLDKMLRPYQKEGVKWLWFLRTYHLGGILADDMGLGKTVQILSFLLSCPHKRPSLIICPKSLLYNWLHEAKRFTPQLKVLLIQGNRKNRQNLLRQAIDCDLAITSYPLFQCDVDQYLAMTFDTCILDETQMIKNPDTHLARQVKRINAEYRLALSGTPMENSKTDLWSIFDFVMPGFLGPQEAFKARYVNTPSPSEVQDLVRRIRPFLLRRTKKEVLPELPPKIEETIYVDLTQNQLSLYLHTLQQIRKDLKGFVAINGIGRSQIEILAGLMRLRQICNHPGLLFPQYRESAGLSGKMDMLDMLVKTCLANHHKVLIFSQFTQMLALIAEKLASQRIRFLVLEGQTSDRQSVINHFNQDEQIRIFLISLKAGGFGLNLTSADTVVLFDPWWNPMVEDQAADRVHRIGQQRTVTIYRLITQNTIEEKIERLQQRKRRHFDAIVNNAGVRSDTLSVADLKYLLDDDF